DTVKRKSNWFDMLLKSNIDQDEDCIIGLSAVTMAKKIKGLIKKDELTIADLEVLEEAQWSDEEVGLQFSNVNQVKRIDNKEYEFSYVDLPRLNLNDVEDMYLLKVQGKLHHIKLEFKIDFINALLLYIRRVVIKNRIGDLQLGVESYQHTLDLTKHKFYFLGIDHKIPYTTSGTENGVVYLNKHDMKSLMKLDEVHKFCDGNLLKVQENLLKMVNNNKLGCGNEKLEGRDWSKSDIKRSKEMLEKIDKTLKHREQLGRLKEYVGKRPKTIEPHLFVRP
ncbi:hypothetical protein Tco_1456597, partial [Tanacetum coccineum]